MTSPTKFAKWCHGIWFFLVMSSLCLAAPTSSSGNLSLEDVLDRTSTQVSGFLEQFSDVKCTEQVVQEKFGKDGKVELKRESTFDYLVILTNSGRELALDESRLAVREAKADRKNTPLLVSNGFATLFLIFHPFYVEDFRFEFAGMAQQDGHTLVKVRFQHIPGMRSPAALALRGRDYPLELSGEAWIEPETGIITHIVAGIESSLEDVGLKSLRSEVEFAPSAFHDMKMAYWFPAMATVEVETPRQHWRNTHRFTDYKRFSVSTEEQVTSK